MKVWIVDQNANLMYYAYSLSLGLVQHGCHVDIITRKNYEWVGPSHQNIQVSELFSRWSMTLIQRSRLLRRFRIPRMLIKIIEYPIGYLLFWRHYQRTKPDIIHFQYANVPVVEWLVFKLLHWRRVPFLFTVHNVIQPRPTPLDRLLYRALYRQIDYFIVHSNHNKESLRQIFTIESERIRVIPHGNYNAYLPAIMPDQAAARTMIGLPHAGKIILFFGIIFEFKGLEYLIRAFAQVDPRIKAFLVIAGQPTQGFEKYAAEIRRLKLEQRVLTRTEFISNAEMVQLFAAADVVVLPYKRISQSGVIFVAFSFAKPVVATRVGSFPETILEGQNGFLVPPEDENALSATLNRILADDVALRRMGMMAKRISDERYDWGQIAVQTLRVYQQVREHAA